VFIQIHSTLLRKAHQSNLWLIGPDSCQITTEGV
jgi:hypothetical protein